MRRLPHTAVAHACLLVLGGGQLAGTAQAQEQVQTLPEVMVQGGRLAQKAFDTPAAVQHIDARTIEEAGPQVNLSEALGRVPGVVALNRNNYAQDVQISIRGFGARAAFGLRGIRLIVDGIPATTPDGQGQASTVSLSSAARIEVLSGPLAQLYGNASGGVIQTFTREAGEQPQLDAGTTLGRFGLQRHDVQLSGRAGPVGIVADYSLFDSDGWRAHSAARRKHFNAVISSPLGEDTTIKVVANVFDMPEAQDPLGLTLALWQADPRQAGTRAVENGARKSVQQSQAGLVMTHRFSPALQMQWRAYTGTRQNLQYQAGRSTQAAASGAWVSLDREFHGLGGQLQGLWSQAPGGPMDWVLGMDLDRSSELRQGGATSAGQISGNPTRDETNTARNTDLYSQLNWHWVNAEGHNPYTLTAGLRRSQVRLGNSDHLPALDGDGTGRVGYRATSPVLGITWHALESLNLFANWGKGFETPTLAEAAYTVESGALIGKFNTQLQAARSQHAELGLKWTPSPASRVGASLFHIRTENELVTLLSTSGKTAFKNAARTLREGLELGWQQHWAPQWRSELSATWLRAVYDTDFSAGSSTVPAGKRLPGIPEQQLFASLQWAESGFGASRTAAPLGWSAAADWVLRSGLWANDLNDTDARVCGFGQLNLKLRHRSLWGPVRTEVWLGVDNVGDRQNIGSVIVNQASKQYFEPGLPRHWMLGLKLAVPL